MFKDSSTIKTYTEVTAVIKKHYLSMFIKNGIISTVDDILPVDKKRIKVTFPLRKSEDKKYINTYASSEVTYITREYDTGKKVMQSTEETPYSLGKKLSEYEDLLPQKDREIELLKFKIKTLSSATNELRSELNSSKELVGCLNDDLSNVKKSNTSLEKEVRELRANLYQRYLDTVKLNTTLDNLKEHNRLLSKELERLRAINSETINADVPNSSAQLQKALDEITRLSKLLNTVRDEVIALGKQELKEAYLANSRAITTDI